MSALGGPSVPPGIRHAGDEAREADPEEDRSEELQGILARDGRVPCNVVEVVLFGIHAMNIAR